MSFGQSTRESYVAYCIKQGTCTASSNLKSASLILLFRDTLIPGLDMYIYPSFIDNRSVYRFNSYKERVIMMTFQSYLESRNMTKYYLSQISGVPKSTLNDICSGKSSIAKCSAKTVFQLSKALNCTMEYIMSFDTLYSKCDINTGKPLCNDYLEYGLPQYLQQSLKNMIDSWEILDKGEKDFHWDIYWSDLSADINSAEIEQEISSEQAWYLREKYLRIKRGD